MKRIGFIVLAMSICCQAAFGWGRVGHAAIAKVAENHLTPKAKQIIDEYLDGESIVKYASYADKYKSTLLIDLGFDPVGWERVTTYPHTSEANEACEPFRGINDNGRYVKNCMHFIEKMAEELKDHKNLSDSLRFHNIVMIVHFVGDMHCPEHIRYYPDDMSIGKYPVTFNGVETTMHKVWDSQIIAALYPSNDHNEVAESIDKCSKKEIRKIAAGGPYDWAAASAKVSKPVHATPEGAVLESSYAEDHRQLAESQLRNAGYRLAKILNKVLK